MKLMLGLKLGSWHQFSPEKTHGKSRHWDAGAPESHGVIPQVWAVEGGWRCWLMTVMSCLWLRTPRGTAEEMWNSWEPLESSAPLFPCWCLPHRLVRPVRLLPCHWGAASFPSDLGACPLEELLLAVLASVGPGESLPLGEPHTEGKPISCWVPRGPFPESDVYQSERTPLGCTSKDHWKQGKGLLCGKQYLHQHCFSLKWERNDQHSDLSRQLGCALTHLKLGKSSVGPVQQGKPLSS